MPNRSHTGNLILRMLLVAVLFGAFAPQARAQGLSSLLDKLFSKGDPSDTTQVVRPKKPLESYFFDDSLRNKSVLAWRAYPGFNEVDTVIVDTMPNRFEVDYPFMVQDVGSAYLGNLGGASIPLNYFRRPRYKDFSFLQSYDAYLITTEKVRYYNVKRPFTQLSYFTAGQNRVAEEQLRVVHAQNISPSTGANIEYYNRNTKGMYSSQRSTDKNFSFAVNHTGKRYSVHGGYVYNMGEIRENGGIQFDSDIIDTVYNPSYGIPVNLRDAKNTFKWNSFHINQAYGIPLQKVREDDFSIAGKSSIFIGHALEYTHVHRRYTDTRANSREVFYEDWLYHPSQTADSLTETKLDNKLYIQIQPFDRNAIIGTIDAGIGYAMHKYYMFTPDQYIVAHSGEKRNDTYLYGAVRGKLRHYIGWGARLDYHPVGDWAQDIRMEADLSLSANIRSRPVTLTVSGSIDNRSAGYWTENFYSNHLEWSTDFDKETETRLEATLSIPSVGLEAGVWQTMIKDKIYYGDNTEYEVIRMDDSGVADQLTHWDQKPHQYSGNISITGFYLQKNFKAGIFNFNHRVLLQSSSNKNIIDLPAVSAYFSYFMDFYLVRNVLRMQLGLDGWYNTEYYAPAYSPVTMQFYNQKEKKLGNYPYLDVFLSAKWKRMRILVKLQHFNEDMFGKRNYFTVLHHPMNRTQFKIGLSWSFYD